MLTVPPPNGIVIQPTTGTGLLHDYDSSTGMCNCPGCQLAAFMNSVVYGNQKIASLDVMDELPSASYRGVGGGAPPPAYHATRANGGVPASIRDLKVCPMFEAFGFCMYGRTCLLAHSTTEAPLHVPAPLITQPATLIEAVERLFALGETHSTQSLWECHVCGYSAISEYLVVKVGETYTYRYCPNCTVSCYLPELLHVVELTIDAVGDDYQLYKDMIEVYRSYAPDILKIPITYEAHRIATTLFAWSLVGPQDALTALEGLHQSCPEVDRVVSLGAGTGFVEHVLNRVANHVSSAPAVSGDIQLCRSVAKHITASGRVRDRTIPKTLNVVEWLQSSYDGVVSTSYAGSSKRLAFFAFDEIIRPARYSVSVNYGEPHVLLSMDCTRSALLLCWPPFGSPEEEQSSMGFEALRHYTKQGGRAVIYVGDVSSTGDWRFHSLLAQQYVLCPSYIVRKEVRRWCPQDMGLVYAGCDTIAVYVRRDA